MIDFFNYRLYWTLVPDTLGVEFACLDWTRIKVVNTGDSLPEFNSCEPEYQKAYGNEQPWLAMALYRKD